MIDNSSNELEVGTVLKDKWVILEFVGKGAMEEVYRAHQLSLKRDIAIKIIEDLDDETEIETTFHRFRREVEAMAQIRHPNVLQVFDYDSFTIKKGDDYRTERIMK
jgi:serine/threonine-protein kinase